MPQTAGASKTQPQAPIVIAWNILRVYLVLLAERNDSVGVWLGMFQRAGVQVRAAAPVNTLLVMKTLPATFSDSVVPSSRQTIRTAPVSAREKSTPWPTAATIIQRFDRRNICAPEFAECG